MQHIYVIQQLSVVEKSEHSSAVMNSNDDVEGETCLRQTILNPVNHSIPNESRSLRGENHV